MSVTNEELTRAGYERDMAEVHKLNAETRKLLLETRHYPIALYLGLAGAAAALFTALSLTLARYLGA